MMMFAVMSVVMPPMIVRSFVARAVIIGRLLRARFCISHAPLAARICQRTPTPAAWTKFIFHSYTS